MSDEEPQHRDVLIVGGGIAGLTAALFTARAGLDTLVYDGGESILRRNAHLENFPGFPAGVNPRLFADMLHAQATRNGADLVAGRITELRHAEDGRFVATAEDGDEISADRVIAASWSNTDYLDPVEPEIRSAGSKQFLDDDPDGHTSVDGLYAAGRLAERYHQAVVAAGDGARTAITLIHDSETPFYHDWVAPEGYFTDRDREVPPGCEEIDETERAARRAESRAAMREYFDGEHEQRQRTHPSLVDDGKGRLEGK
ncbi:NAD(P)/FAD-dependent oxidoreductase [Halolamina sp. CBA1230]|uniref:NAD(P)/FAD-dependent oxidoreductase n=1 Tax=Halolamina sp. CBA1230 TaxID=1853690 RepID=UPI0009A1B896|nr:NAD(P)/FAD-dependent oxidoreductase [Halolamina sp. CBA1230]QKY21689.1 NAD(P)/FAD-dependent oxidoreductase [Halolamina sp. CBA1230]